MEVGGWRLEIGDWEIAGWRLEIGDWEIAGWRLEIGDWEIAGWRLEIGDWEIARLEVGSMSPTRGSPVWRALRAAARSAATRDSARAPLCGVGDEELGVFHLQAVDNPACAVHSAR